VAGKGRGAKGVPVGSNWVLVARIGEAVSARKLPAGIIEAVILQINHDDVLEAIQAGDIPPAADRLAGRRTCAGRGTIRRSRIAVLAAGHGDCKEEKEHRGPHPNRSRGSRNLQKVGAHLEVPDEAQTVTARRSSTAPRSRLSFP
jgi:hypothetical protein